MDKNVPNVLDKFLIDYPEWNSPLTSYVFTRDCPQVEGKLGTFYQIIQNGNVCSCWKLKFPKRGIQETLLR